MQLTAGMGGLRRHLVIVSLSEAKQSLSINQIYMNMFMSEPVTSRAAKIMKHNELYGCGSACCYLTPKALPLKSMG